MANDSHTPSQSGKARVKQLVGEVVSLSSPKTVIVKITRTFRHPLYKKIVRKSKRIAAHYELPNLSLRDKVLLVGTRPMSKTKRFLVTKIVEKI
jgi:small subunit ribosomal protein S17